MTTRRPVPGPVYDLALAAYIRGDAPDDAHNEMIRFAIDRWPGTPIPKQSKDVALWVLGIAIRDGVAREVRD